MVIDTHAHINDEIYSNLDELIAEMPNDNLEKIVCASADKKGSIKAVEIASNNKNIYAMIGLHPDNAYEFDKEFVSFVRDNATNKKVVAIGEIGLDYHSENYDKELQQKVFIEQLKLAHEFSLPVVIHVRDAYDDLLSILKLHRDLITNSGIIHCFSGSLEIAREFIKLGFKIAFGGVLTFKNARKSVEVAQALDISNLVVETDCPWLYPEPHRGEINEPKNVNYVVQKLADIKNMQKEKLEPILIENTYQVFPKLEK